MTEKIEQVCFKIISNVGNATSCYVEAMRLAKDGQIAEARAMVEEGGKTFIEGHKAHMELLTQECQGDKTEMCLLLVHAEDQLNKAEILEILANQFIDMAEKLANK